MPYVSDETVSWANRVLSTGSAAGRKAMLTTNAVLPPAGGIDLAGRSPERNSTRYARLHEARSRRGGSIRFTGLRPVSQNGSRRGATKQPSDCRPPLRAKGRPHCGGYRGKAGTS
jgi:hypothetical protein